MKKSEIHDDMLLKNESYNTYVYIAYAAENCCWGNAFSEGTSYLLELEPLAWNLIYRLKPIKNEDEIRKEYSSFIEESRQSVFIDLLEDRL